MNAALPTNFGRTPLATTSGLLCKNRLGFGAPRGGGALALCAILIVGDIVISDIILKQYGNHRRHWFTGQFKHHLAGVQFKKRRRNVIEVDAAGRDAAFYFCCALVHLHMSLLLYFWLLSILPAKRFILLTIVQAKYKAGWPTTWLYNTLVLSAWVYFTASFPKYREGSALILSRKEDAHTVLEMLFYWFVQFVFIKHVSARLVKHHYTPWTLNLPLYLNTFTFGGIIVSFMEGWSFFFQKQPNLRKLYINKWKFWWFTYSDAQATQSS